MHIPDNYLSPSTCAVMGAAMVPVWSKSAKKIKQEIPREKIPLLGIGAAFSFLFMMFNVPLPGGTTGHAVGGTLLAVLLGPYAACISVTVALLIQALLFGDGGILAFGANCFNMAFILPFLGYYIYRLIRDRAKTEKGEYIGMALGSYIGLNAAALSAAVQFGLQPLLFKDAAGQPLYCPYSLAVSIPAMTIPHLLAAGVVEAAFTVAVAAFIKKASPDTFYENKNADRRTKSKAVYGLVLALICLTPLGLLASGTAWGEWGADEIGQVVSGGDVLGYVPKGMAGGFQFESLMPDYSLNGMPEIAGYILSAAAGTAVIIIFFKIISALKKEKAGNKVGKS